MVTKRTTEEQDKEDEYLRQTHHRQGTKTATAYAIWYKLHSEDPDVSRHICIEAAQREADMTPASASTIYQAWRTEQGLVNHPDDNAIETPTTKGKTPNKK